MVTAGKRQADVFQWALRISRDFFHERLAELLLVQAYDPLGQGGALERLAFTYDLTEFLPRMEGG